MMWNLFLDSNTQFVEYDEHPLKPFLKSVNSRNCGNPD